MVSGNGHAGTESCDGIIPTQCERESFLLERFNFFPVTDRRGHSLFIGRNLTICRDDFVFVSDPFIFGVNIEPHPHMRIMVENN
jgi:hypothetical protein